MPSPDPFEDLEDLLEHEHDAILNGRLQDLSRLLHRKEDLLKKLADIDPPESAALATLKARADHNQVLLGSVLRGIKSVQDRIASMRDGRSTHTTYTQAGLKQPISAQHQANFERRA